MADLLISWVVAGAVAGILGFLFSPRVLPGSIFTNLVVGAAGGVIGGWVIATATGTAIVNTPATWGSLVSALFSGLVLVTVALSEGKKRAK